MFIPSLYLPFSCECSDVKSINFKGGNPLSTSSGLVDVITPLQYLRPISWGVREYQT